jgi:hypothetical protein
MRLNCPHAVDTSHLIDTVGVIFTGGCSMVCSGDSYHRLNPAIESSGVGAAVGCQTLFATGKGEESKV